MFVLEEERDYFRFQVGKLDGEVRKLQADIKSLRKALAEARDEIKNYKHICFSKKHFMQNLRKTPVS
jgi:predicted  nucleic acid-binding Zn-ribbon protein